MTAQPLVTEARNLDLDALGRLLMEQQAAKVDFVTNAAALWFDGGNLTVSGSEKQIDRLDMDGVTVTATDGTYVPTAVFDSQMADRLGVPQRYMTKMRAAGRTDLLDANVNGWLHGPDGTTHDARDMMVRGFRYDGGNVARALLSDRFDIIDHLDGLTGVLKGVAEAGVDVEVVSTNITEQYMRVRLTAPAISAEAPTLLKGYRSPFRQGAERAGGFDGLDNRRRQVGDVVEIGVEIRNSETGHSAFKIVPVVTVLACTNGMTATKDALTARHLGARLDHGVVQWGADTKRTNADLTTKMARDAVKTFLNPDYLRGLVADIEAKAGKPIEGPVQAKVEEVGKALAFSQDEIAGVLAHFIDGGQRTAGGVMNAVTSFAQTLASPDRAGDIEDKALDALALAAR